ncbi:MAG: family 10 glycosylhydrolase [Ruminococcus sp.]|nr:family 10 glycosylhydrolase [Ruminococcus sp.]
MKQIFIMVVAFLLLCGCAERDKPTLSPNSPKPPELSDISYIRQQEYEIRDCKYNPLRYEEMHAVWLTYIELSELFANESSSDDLRRDSDKLFGKLSELGINTVFLHVRAFGDAFYDSELFAPTRFLTFGCDPLEIMLETAHAHEIAVHVWVNPLRCETEENMYRSEGTLIGEWYNNRDSYPGYIVMPENDIHYWLNPAVPKVRQLAADGVTELCENYDIDGVHIDDYFYPTTDESFDAVQYAAYEGALSLADWRRENCTLLVKALYSAVKEADPAIIFSVSPQGNIANNYDLLYADAERWCSEEGCLDIIIPQIYFGYDNEVCPFSETLAEWIRLAHGKTLVCGIGMYKAAAGEELSGGEYSGVIARQINEALSSEGCGGFAVYSCSSLLNETDPALIGERAAAAAVIKRSSRDHRS